MKQLIMIGGGEVFDTQENYKKFLKECRWDLRNPPASWKNRLCDSVSHEYEAIKLQMPNTFNCEYVDWKLWFEKYFKYLNGQDTVLVGFSLGATFLLKYLSENDFQKGIAQLHLVAPMLDGKGLDELEDTARLTGVGDFDIDQEKLSVIQEKTESICLYHSQDDEVVPFDHGQRLSELLPSAKFEIFETRGHFMQPAFPELLANLDVYTR